MRMWMNSKYVKEGDYFLVDINNSKYVSEAIDKGAARIITELDEIYDIETIKVDNIKKYLYENYKNDIDDLTLIGITGTNGKTTTCYLIYQMLNFLGVKTSYLGTIGFYLDDRIINLDNTTPSMDIIYNLLLDAKKTNTKVVVMEVSSHSLKQDRIYGLLYDAIVVTNVTKEHLDYHNNMNDYINAKKRLISLTKNKKICILNKKDKYYKKFISKDNNNFIIGKNLKIKRIKRNLDYTLVKFKDNKNKYNKRLKLVGDFNIYNFLMAYKTLDLLGYDSNKILENSCNFIEPIGRMQKIMYKENVIFVDYAHTPDAVLNVLKTVKKIKNKGIITIIGCGGNRDKTKRSIMGKIACNNSNYVIFTNDNPRDEDERKIMEDILVGAKGKYEVIYDRYNAIKKGISMLDNNKILMILGKGHEDYQIIKGIKYHFSDMETVNNIVKNFE